MRPRSWAGKLPSQLVGLDRPEIEAVLERETYEVLEALANPDTYVRRSADANVPRPRKTHEQPVLGG